MNNVYSKHWGGGGGVCWTPVGIFVVYSYLLNFCRQWHLCKFLILVDLSIKVLNTKDLSIKVGFFKSLLLKK